MQDLNLYLDQYLSDHRNAIIADLMDLIRVKSLRGESLPGAPYGQGVRKALDSAAAKMKALGYAVKIPEHGKYGYCDIGEGPKIVGIMPHLDVVAAEGTWICDPFDPIIQDGYVIGRGSSDDKGGAVASMDALDAIARSGIKLKNRIRLIWGCNEETGMEDVHAIREDQNKPDFTLIPDAFFAIGVGEKGRISLKLCMNQKLTTICSFSGGKENGASVPDYASCTVKYDASLYEKFQQACLGTNIVCTLQNNEIALSAKGISAHPAMPQGGANAISILAEFLSKTLPVDNPDCKTMQMLSGLTAGYSGKGLDIDYQDSLSGPLTCVCIFANSRSGGIDLQFNIRYCVTLEKQALLTSIERKLPEYNCEIIECNAGDSHLFDTTHPIIGVLKEAFQQAVGQNADLYVHPGGTYAGRMGDAVIFGNEFRQEGLFGPERGNPHQIDEATSIERLLLSIKAYVHTLLAIDQIL